VHARVFTSESRFDYLKNKKKPMESQVWNKEKNECLNRATQFVVVLFSSSLLISIIKMKKGQTTVEMIQYFSMSIV
jgi:hypothetical protein